ncbi:DoxX family protein [Streptomyces sp. NPDC101062]|uniref:DoxX family protein n=1 Tax=unclassified Streptomyces TaxID=2593676 RepID=UPI003817AB07
MPAQPQTHMGLSPTLVRFIGAAETAAAGGLIVGLWARHARANGCFGTCSAPSMRSSPSTPLLLAMPG